jgi:ABC-type nitrate/sulfonate/bicarbonate transport system permease component
MAAADVRGQRGGMSRPAQVLAVQIATFLLVWGGWEALSRSGLLYEGVVPSSLVVFPAIVRHLADPVFWDHMGRTAYEVVSGFAIGASVGVAVGLLLGMRRFLAAVIEPYINYLAATPKIVFLPIMMVLFGVGAGSKIAMGAISAFFPVVVSVYRGMLLVNPVHIRVARSFKASQWTIVRSVYLPSIVPPLLTGLRLGLGVAIVGTLLAEIKLANKGLGYVVIQHYNFFRTADMYAVLIIIFLIAVGINTLMDRLAKRYSHQA